MSIPLEAINLIAQFIEPNPVSYLRIACISRSFYLVFMADKLWRRLDHSGTSHNISEHFLNKAISWSSDQRTELLHCWSDTNVGRGVSNITTPDALFGAIVTGLNITPQPQINSIVFMSSLLEIYPGSFRYASENLKDNYELALKAVSCNRYALGYISEALRSDKHICLAAIRFDPWCLEQASPQIQASLEVVLQAVILDGRSLKFASRELRDYEPVVKVAVGQNGTAIKFASERLRNDFELALKAINQTCWGWLGISSELQKDKTIIDTVLANSHPLDWQLLQQIKHQVQLNSSLPAEPLTPPNHHIACLSVPSSV